MNTIYNDIVVATWGIGPTYRDRIKHNIRKAIGTGYPNILPYVILTDNVSDFDEIINETDKILRIIDINKEREKYSKWSFDVEFIPNTNDVIQYSKEYREKNNKEGKIFSYGLNRFSLPTISEMGYSRFLMCDCDTDIRYDRIISGEVTETEFWNEYLTPTQTMKGCDLEHFNRRTEHWGYLNIILANHLRYYLKTNRPNNIDHPSDFVWLSSEYWQTEGPFRYYNLKSPEMVMDVFNIWNDLLCLCLTDSMFKKQLCPGGYMYIDNVTVSVTNEYLGISPLNFDKFWHTVNVYKSDRFYFPAGFEENVNGEKLSLQPTNTKEEFYEVNKKLIDYYKNKGQWVE